MQAIIETKNVSKTFPARRGFRDLRGRGGLTSWLKGQREEKFTALHDISLEVMPGESVGIIGRNGSGKSTLLSLIAGVTLPSSGHVFVRGRVASLLELGAGFNPVLTGRENIYLNAGLLGMRHAEVDKVYDEIVRFSGIADFIDQPVETYSSGMYVRIGFSVAAFVNPDIFLADEVLAVGDVEFQRKCRTKIGELREQGKTIVFVSHDLGIVNTLCERIVLLDNGRMIQRDTPQKTITYYLRQVGLEKGLHTFSDGDFEAIHCDGRISLFHKQEEVSASSGFRMQMSSLGQEHFSTDAEWQVTDKTPQGCTVTGQMMRLPVCLIWEIRFIQGRLVWRISMECERECPIDAIYVQCFLPTAYTHWIYGDLSGTFPQIIPLDRSWSILAAPEVKAPSAAALPSVDSNLAPLVFTLTQEASHFGLYWANTEYALYARVLTAQARFPEQESVFPAGVHALMELSIDAGVPPDEINAKVCSDRTVVAGKLSARFEHGQVRLFYENEKITQYLHLYSSMLIEHLWNDSQSLQWGGVARIPCGIRLRGESRRFPFSQEWELSEVAGGIHLRIWLETTEDLEVQEYHTTIVLPPVYDRWATDQEQAIFPEYVIGRQHWTHCNRSYALGKSIVAYSADLPSVTILLDDECPEMRLTAINTSEQEKSRALQALRPSNVSHLSFPTGKYLYFSGIIRAIPLIGG